MVSDDEIEDALDTIFRPLLMPMALRFLWAGADVRSGTETRRGRFTVLEYAMASRYVTSYLNPAARDSSTGLLDTILGFYFRNGGSTFPTLDQLVEIVATRGCGCLLAYDEELLKSAHKWCISGGNWAFIASCEEIDIMMEYHTLQNRWPNFEEILEFSARQMQFMMDPEGFHQRDRIHVPALNVDFLPVEKGGNGDTCAICHEEITEAQEALILEPCKHRYHNSSETCLGGASIRTWLNQHNFCPMCKGKVN